MALPTRAAINAAINDIFAAFSEDKTKNQSQAGVNLLNELIRPLREAYARIVTITLAVTDATDATLTAFIAAAGELGIAAGGIVAPVGTIFEVTGTGDTTDNALGAVKGSLPAAGDQFQVLTAATVSYLGAASDFDFADEDSTTFIDL